jgi:RND family efflux transporter MFP subunit
MEKTNLRIMKKMFNTMAAGLIIAAVGIQGCNGTSADGLQSDALQERPVKVMTVAGATAVESRTFPGIVKAAREIDLAFRVGGPLVQYDLKIGQQVNKGETIARIDPRDFEIRVGKLNAELKAAEAKLEDAEKDFQRQKNLLSESAASQSQYDKIKMILETTQAGIESLKADLASAKNALADTRLTAPFDGVVNRKLAENHETVAPGIPVVSILDLSGVEVATAIPEDILIRESDFSQIYVTLEAYPGETIPATLEEIGRQTDATNQSYPLTAVLDVPDHLSVEPGMAAMLHVMLHTRGQETQGFYLPTSAVFSDTDGTTCIWRVDTDTLNTEKVPVETGGLRGNDILIVSGLVPGDHVISAGARFLVEGQRIRILKGNGEAVS